MQIQDVKLAVVGLGYVGLPLAVAFGKQREVIGFDINEARIEALKNGHDHTLELDSAELASATGLRYTFDPTALAEANVYIVTMPTPIDEFKQPDLTPLIRASETIGRALRRVILSFMSQLFIRASPKKFACQYLNECQVYASIRISLPATVPSALIREIKSIESRQLKKSPRVQRLKSRNLWIRFIVRS